MFTLFFVDFIPDRIKKDKKYSPKKISDGGEKASLVERVLRLIKINGPDCRA